MSAGELILTHKLVKMAMELTPDQSRRMGGAGASAVTKFGPSLWRLEVETGHLTLDEERAWNAWFARREGAAYTFTAWQLLQYAPKGALGTADGSIGLTVDIANGELDLTGTGAYVASAGDMISYRTLADGFYLGVITEDATAVAGAVTVKVQPTPVAAHATVPAVRRVQALGEFEITTGPGIFGDYSDRRVRFEAMQIPR